MRLIRHHDDVGAVGKLGIGRAALGVEFLDQGESIAVVFAEQQLEMGAALGRNLLLAFGDDAAGSEIFVDLVVQIVAVGDQQKRPVAGQFAQHFLCEENHGKAFAAALGVPEHAQFALIAFYVAHRFQGVVNAEKLVIFGQHFNHSAARLLKDSKVFGQVEQARGFAGAAYQGFQRNDTGFFLAADFLPFGEMIPSGGQAANARVDAVRQDDKSVVPEDVRDGVFVVAQIIVEGVLDAFVRGFEFDENQRQAIDKTDQIGAARIHFAAHPQLLHQKKVILCRIVPRK